MIQTEVSPEVQNLIDAHVWVKNDGNVWIPARFWYTFYTDEEYQQMSEAHKKLCKPVSKNGPENRWLKEQAQTEINKKNATTTS